MNQAGQIVGTYTQAGVGIRGFLLHEGNFTTGISVRPNSGTDIRGINPQGDIVGTVFGGGLPFQAFKLSGGVVTEFGFPNATHTIAEDIDANGAIVGYYGLAGVDHGFVYEDGAFTTIQVPGSQLTVVRGINPEGEMVGVYTLLGPDGVTRLYAFLRSKNGVFTTLDVPNGGANGINPRGQIVGEYSPDTSLRPRFGFLLSGGKYTTIMYPGAYVTRAVKITPDGQHIVGFYNELVSLGPPLQLGPERGFLLSRRPSQ
jgi:uncharacterized membrane protein